MDPYLIQYDFHKCPTTYYYSTIQDIQRSAMTYKETDNETMTWELGLDITAAKVRTLGKRFTKVQVQAEFGQTFCRIHIKNQ